MRKPLVAGNWKMNGTRASLAELGDMGKIRLSKARLDNLGYFERVEIVPVATEMAELKDLRIELSEKPTGHVSLGAGYSTEDSVIGFVEFTESNFDIARLFNWPPKGAGQRLRRARSFSKAAITASSLRL